MKIEQRLNEDTKISLEGNMSADSVEIVIGQDSCEENNYQGIDVTFTLRGVKLHEFITALQLFQD